jgi:redox-sensitive bicupin YhaK (pirin superfamily)
MTTIIRKASDRGRVDLGWLDSRHSFSFGHYRDPAHMGFGALRVINEDRVAPGGGFATHAHSDMEIVSYVLEGALEHKDSLGTGSIIKPGDVQRMTAGSGIRHSEHNASKTEPVHFLQIWIIPERQGLEPSYEQKAFALDENPGRAILLGSPDGRDGSVTIHADVDLWGGQLQADQSVHLVLRPGRKAWIQVAKGSVVLDGQPLTAGDGAAIEQAAALELRAAESQSQFLLFDLAN